MRNDQEGLARPRVIRNYSSEHENAQKPGQLTFALISLFNEATINLETVHGEGCCHGAGAAVNAPSSRRAPGRTGTPRAWRHRSSAPGSVTELELGAARSGRCVRDRDPPGASRPGGGRSTRRYGHSDPRDTAVRPAVRPARGACWGACSAFRTAPEQPSQRPVRCVGGPRGHTSHPGVPVRTGTRQPLPRWLASRRVNGAGFVCSRLCVKNRLSKLEFSRPKLRGRHAAEPVLRAETLLCGPREQPASDASEV